MQRSVHVALLVALSQSACSGGDAAAPLAGAPAPSSTAPGGTTFHKDVEPILQRACQSCHVPGGIAPFALLTYADAKVVAGSVVAQTKARTMPPWGAQDTSECKPPKPWKDDLRLTEAELATLEAWHVGGDPEGDPKDAPPPRSTAPSAGLAGSVSLAPATPFDLKASTDTLRCFVLDPKLAGTKYMTATNFVPTNETIVHHALAFAIPPGSAVPGDAYDCFGGPNVPGANLIAAWAPGGVPNEYPPDVGLALPAGTRIVVQVHYHPHANARPEPDATAFQLRLSEAAPTYQAVTRLIGNFSAPVDPATGIGLEAGPDDVGGVAAFRVPANAKAHVETMHFTMPSIKAAPNLPVWILSVGAHMHLAGHDEKITLTHNGQSTCLLQEPSWNFNWQRSYQYDAAIEALPSIATGDVLQVRCTYDNTIANAALTSARREAGVTTPADIGLGESTTDEMCLGAFTFVYRAR
jgi:hypothetical protein